MENFRKYYLKFVTLEPHNSKKTKPNGTYKKLHIACVIGL